MIIHMKLAHQILSRKKNQISIWHNSGHFHSLVLHSKQLKLKARMNKQKLYSHRSIFFNNKQMRWKPFLFGELFYKSLNNILFCRYYNEMSSGAHSRFFWGYERKWNFFCKQFSICALTILFTSAFYKSSEKIMDIR